MGECYAHEECEFNGQPECRLPDGMECPHGVKADKPAAESWTDIEALIERLNQYSQPLIAYKLGADFADACMDAATALSTLQAENDKLKRALAEMWFAYINKDGAVPHDFEEKAVQMAQEILGPWGEMVKWLGSGPKED